MRRGGQLALRKRDLGMPVVKAARRVRVRLRRLLSSPLRRARVAFPPGVVRALALVCVGGSCGLLAEHLAAWSYDRPKMCMTNNRGDREWSQPLSHAGTDC